MNFLRLTFGNISLQIEKLGYKTALIVAKKCQKNVNVLTFRCKRRSETQVKRIEGQIKKMGSRKLKS